MLALFFDVHPHGWHRVVIFVALGIVTLSIIATMAAELRDWLARRHRRRPSADVP